MVRLGSLVPVVIVATALISPALAQSPLGNPPPTPLSQLPPDQSSNNGPFASYMYESLLPRPRGLVAGRIATFASVVPFQDTHVSWCRANFASYDLTSDTYLGFDGLRRPCVSPY